MGKLLPNNDAKSICDQIYLLLLLNQLQYLTVRKILNYIVKNKRKIYLNWDQQLLIYIRDKGEIEKNRILKAIKMSFTLLSKRKKLVISAPIAFAANSIRRNIVYTTLRVNNRARKNYQVKINT